MAFPSVVSQARTEFFGGETTTHNVAMGTGIEAGMLLLVEIFVTGTPTITATGFTEILTQTGGGNRYEILAKIATGSENSTNVNFVTSSGAFAIAHRFTIDDWFGDLTTGLDAVAATGTSATPNPPSNTAAWGGAADNLWIASAAKASGSISTAPANFTNVLNGDNMGTARRENAVDTEDPGTFGGSGSSAYVTTTLAIRPAGVAAQPLTGALFSKAPTFFAGAVTPGAVNLTGALFPKAPTFPQGVVTPGAVDLTGALFSKAPSFAQGAVALDDSQAIAGALFTKGPTFPTGTVTAGPVALVGALFSKAATFFAGVVSPSQAVTGTLFQKTATFFTGSVTPGAVTLAGTLFSKAATFFKGAVFGVIVHPTGPGDTTDTPGVGKTRTTSTLGGVSGARRPGQAAGSGSSGQTTGGTSLGE